MPLPSLSYEEIREIILDILLQREQVGYKPDQFDNLVVGVGEVISRRNGQPNQRPNPQNEELVRDVFWDLFRQGFITLGMNNANTNWPFFRFSHFGQRMLVAGSPWRFHDTTSYLALIRKEVPDILPESVSYLDEAASAFYAGCLLAACVMLGVAAEAEFLRLIEVAKNSPSYGPRFSGVPKERFVRQKIAKFRNALEPIRTLLPKEAVGDLDTNFNMIQAVLRVARNEAGHPTAVTPEREQVYVYLQLFAPLGRQLRMLRGVLSS
jgi:hypothetical protein